MGDRSLPRARFEPPSVHAIDRDRVARLLDRAWDVPLTLVVGPAGAGKTTAVSHLVQRSGGHAAWYRAHPVDGDEAVFAEHLARAIAGLPNRPGTWTDLDSLLVAAEGSTDRLLVVIDEFDAIIGTTSEQAFAEVLPDLAPTIHFVLIARNRPSVNLSRLRLGPGVAQVGPDDLRFRSWEVDRLFRELYRRPLLPAEVAELERRTGGWVAALQLFNLATSSLPAAERNATIAHVGRRNGPDWDFLAENVLNGLSDELQLFLLETAPLERLTVPLCDALVAGHASAARLEELERLQLVTSSMEAHGTFRSHEVLRSHLDGVLLEWEGADAVRKRYRLAAETLEEHGHFAEALRAYCRGDDWTSASRLLGSRGAEVANRPGSWLVGLPRAMVQADPWLLLANARHQRADGRLTDAIATYQRVESGALTSMPVTVARRERLVLASLLDRSSFPSLAWVAALRDAVVNEPTAAIRSLGERSAHDVLAAGMAQLLAGDVSAAASVLRRARDRSDASPVVSLTADLGLLVAHHLGGQADPRAADELERMAVELDVPVLIRLCRAAGAMVTGSPELIDAVVEESHRAGDRAGAAVAALFGALGRVWGPAAPSPVPLDALERCRALELRTLEAWALAAIALGSVGEPDGPAAAAAADAASRRRGLRSLQELIELCSGPAPFGTARCDTVTGAGIAMPTSLLVRRAHGPTGPGQPSDQPCCLRIQCLGRFAVFHHSGTPGTATHDPGEIELAELRPRARAVLRMLAARGANGVHRQTLCDELWPDDDESGASKKLQVAISSVRRVFDLAGCPHAVRRRSDVYMLHADGGVVYDIDELATCVNDARSLIVGAQSERAEPVMRRAFELYAGALLPEDGAAEWVVTLRQQIESSLIDVSQSLAAALLGSGRPALAVAVCRRGLVIDRFCDPLWRLLLDALDGDGDPAGHAVALAAYDEVLIELGVRRPVGA